MDNPTYMMDHVSRSLANFRYNLKLLRATTELSGKQLAEKLAMSPSRINDLEEGRMPPKMEDAIAIACIFQITLSDLFSRLEIDIPSKRSTQPHNR
jgi:DNA-binding XRE family transcriptional regulator